MSTKVCGKCKEVKTLDGFSKNKVKKDGYSSECKACDKERQAEYRAANPDYHAKWCAANPDYKAEYRAANPEKVKESNDKYRAANPEKNRAKSAEYRAANPEKIKEYSVEYRAANPDYQAKYRADNSEKKKDYQAEWCAANPEKGRAYSSNRRAVKLEAIPPWLTKEDYKAMEAIGKEADRLTKETGIKHEVDHIIPLQPPKVIMFEGEMIPLICAFQCPSNLQILTKSQNCSKGNRFTPYVESES